MVIELSSLEASLALPSGVQELNPTAERSSVYTPHPKEEVPLDNRKLPFYENKHERPAHRLMVELAAKGYDVNEIAERTGYTTVCVNNILRQPRLQKPLLKSIREQVSADEEVVEIIRRNVVNAAKLYESVMNDPAKDVKERMEAAERFMNRRYGKPNQPINRGTDVDLNALSDSELAKMLPSTSGTTNS